MRPAGYDGHVRVVYPYVHLQLLPYFFAGTQNPYFVCYEDPDICIVMWAFLEQYNLIHGPGWVQRVDIIKA